MEGIPDINEVDSILDLLKYAWVVGLYYIRDFTERLKFLESKQAVTPTNEQVEARVDKELSRVITKLDRMENLMTEYLISNRKYPDITLGGK